MKSKLVWIGGALLAVAFGAVAIGTDNEIQAALSITAQDMTRLKAAVTRHQSLDHTATTAEAIAELKSRINAFVRSEEAKAGGDTLGQWGGI